MIFGGRVREGRMFAGGGGDRDDARERREVEGEAARIVDLRNNADVRQARCIAA